MSKAAIQAAFQALGVEIAAMPPDAVAPTIASFTATPNSVLPGGSVTLNAIVAGTAPLVLKLDGVVVTLPKVVNPAAAKAYTLVASGPGGTSAPATVSVAVVAPPPVVVPSTRPIINALPLNLSAIVCIYEQYGTSRYERYGTPLILTGDRTVTFGLTDIAAGGAITKPFTYPAYGLEFAGAERARYTRVDAERLGQLPIKVAGLKSDWYRSQLVAYDASGARVTNPVETLMPFWIGVDTDGTLDDLPDFVIQTGSYEWTHLGATHFDVRVPESMAGPVAEPLNTTIPAVPFNTALPPSKIVRIDLVPATSDAFNEPHTPALTASGVMISDNLQPYFISDMIGDFDRLPQIDDVRGRATCQFVLHLRPGRNGKWYGGSPHSIWVIDAAGTKRTLAGARHKYHPASGEARKNGPEVEYLGRWNPSIPAAARYFKEGWAFGWDERTLAVDTGAPPIGNEQPHLGLGPKAFLNDTANNRILTLQFDGHDRTVEPLIDVLCSASDPWGGDFDPVSNTWIVNERLAHRTVMRDPVTGAIVNTVLSYPQGNNLGRMDALRTASAYSLAAARAVPILFPEGGALQDGFWYWASNAQLQVRRVSLKTGVVEVCCNLPLDGNAHYGYIALSDGSFGPRGTIFFQSFSNSNFGMPRAFLPVPGNAPDGTPLTHSQGWGWFTWAHHALRGSATEPQGYGGACAVGNGWLATGSSSNGLDLFRQRDPSDPVVDLARAQRGQAYFQGKGYHLLFGGFCNNRPTSYPLPWGENADLDYTMEIAWGHSKP